MQRLAGPARPNVLSVSLALGVAAIVAAVVLATWLVQSRFGIADLQALIGPLLAEQARAPVLFAALFFAAYVCVTALCIPLEVPFALMAGAVFGLYGGVVLSSFASIIGATIAFLGARFLFRDHVQRRFAGHLDALNLGIERDGAFYLVNLRLVPGMPFSLCNVLMGLTTIRTSVFVIVSQVCMIFATVIFVNAGTQLRALHSLSDILSPALIGGFVALAALPWIGKALLQSFTRRRSTSAPRALIPARAR